MAARLESIVADYSIECSRCRLIKWKGSMYKQAFILSLALFNPASVAAASVGGHPQKVDAHSGLTRGAALAQQMSAALYRQSRIEVRGHLDGPGSQSVKYLVRYQAQGREYMQETGGMWNQVQVGHERLQGLRAIAVGKDLYTSTDGTHWRRGTRLNPPSALDVISINPAMAPCCVPGKTASTQVTNLGVQTSPFGKVYALGYRTTSVNASIKGTLLIDARTFLPRRYTEFCPSMGLSGTFVLTYGGSFTIKAPVR